MVHNASSVPPRDSRHYQRVLLPALAPQVPHVQPRPLHSIPATTGSPRRRSVIPIACDHCRRSKAKCSGDRPRCSRCAHHGLQCRFAGQPGETPAKVLKRDNRSLRDKATTQAKILELLAELPEPEAQDILRRIRAGVPVETICNQVIAGDALMQLAVVPESRFRYTLLYKSEMPESFTHNNPYLDTLLYESASLYRTSGPPGAIPTPPSFSPAMNPGTLVSHKSAYLMPFHSAHVIDPLLSDVKPSKWTTVCQDDMLMRDLLRTWLRCEYIFTSAFQKDYFLEDMSSGSRDFCSELLVNAVLAYCCICYPSFPNRAEYWNPQTLTYKFLAEAKRLWELEATEPRLTTIHAGVILNVLHNLSGLDDIGKAYQENSIFLAQELRLFEKSVQGHSQRMQNGRNFTAWALYSWETLLSFSLLHPPRVPEPPLEPMPDPLVHADWYGEIWLKYPIDHHSTSMNFALLFKHRADLRKIMHRFGIRAYATSIKVPLKEAYGLYAQLNTWKDELPPALQAKNIVQPAQLQLHVYLQHLILVIFEPLLDDVLPAELQQYSRPRDIVAEAVRNMQTLIRLYYLRHGFEAMDLFIVIPLIFVGLKCLESITDETTKPDLELMRTTLMLVVNGLYKQRRNHYLAEVLYRVVRGRMRPEEASLAKETLDLKEDESEQTIALKQAVRSHWPVSVVRRKEDVDARTLTTLVEGMRIDDQSDS